MKKNNKIKMVGRLVLPLAVLAFMVTSCEKDYVYVAPPIDAATAPPVSFLNDVYPILNTHCNLSGCHANNDNPPDFTTAAIAYDQMWVNDNGNVLIDTVVGESSILYVRMTKTGSGKMPPSGILPASQTNVILTWIKQGAKNN